MNKTNDIDNHSRADSFNGYHMFSDEEHSILPNEDFLADSEHRQPNAFSTGEYETTDHPSDDLECVAPHLQSPIEVVGDSANLSTQQTDQLHGPIWAPRPEVRVAALVAALDSAQLEIERQAQKNRELNTRMREIRSLSRQPEVRAAHGAEENANPRARLDGGEDYLQALTAQTGKLETMLDSLTQTHTWVAELNAALDEDLNGRNELASKMQADEGQLTELESLVDQLCGAVPSGTEIPKNAVETEPANIEFLETLSELHVKDLEKLPEVRIKNLEKLNEVHAVNHLFIAMNDGSKCPLDKTVVTIGRGRFNDIQIRSRCVSRSHARIVTNDSDAIIENLDSKNGLTVNGSSVQLRQLRNGDVVEVDNIQFKFIDLRPDDADRGASTADDREPNSDRAADKGGETAQEMRDRRDRRDRRKETREPGRLPQRSGQDGFQDAEGRPDRDAQSAKKPWWKFRE